MASREFFLGIDSSTQSIKAVLLDSGAAIAGEVSVNFDADLPEFETRGGVHRQRDGLTVTSPSIMWVKALDLLLARMKAAGFPFAEIAALSGSGQQHGTVYMKPGAEKILGGLDPRQPLAPQLLGSFSVENSPIWMDSSTSSECRNLELALGGPQAVASLTGSRAYERFSGNQIAKINRTNAAGYAATDRIMLVSSFMASLFACRYAPIDFSDGSGMNLMDIMNKRWYAKAIEVTAPDLERRLGKPCASHAVVGSIGAYFADKYGFSRGCAVVAFSGDNPCSLAGLRLQEEGDVAISMGTSDTMFGSLAQPAPSATEGHIFVNPIDPNGYMAMICYANGSLTREDVRDRCAGGDWNKFEQALSATEPGNSGNIGFFFRDTEITPLVQKPGIFRFDPQGSPVRRFAPEAEVRAVVEGQFLSMRLHSANIGIRPRRVLATGGGSSNKAILKVISQVFGVPVYVGSAPNSAAFGAAYRAMHGLACHKRGAFVPFAEVLGKDTGFTKVMEGAPCGIYESMIARYAELEQQVIKMAGGQ